MTPHPRRAVLRVPASKVALDGPPDLPSELAIVRTVERPELAVVDYLIAGPPLDTVPEECEAPRRELDELLELVRQHRAGTASNLDLTGDVADGPGLGVL